jgi:hypothetical protein
MGIAASGAGQANFNKKANPNFSSGWTSKHQILYKISTINF